METIAHWIKEVLGSTRIDTLILKAHSVRPESTSKAKAMDLSTKNILKKRNCSRESTWQKY